MLAATAACTAAQAIDAPAGWRRLASGTGAEAFETGAGDGRLELVLSGIEAGDGRRLTTWLDERIARDAASFASRPDCRPSRMTGGGAQAACTLAGAGGKLSSVSYAAIEALDGRRRMARIHAAAAEALAGSRPDTVAAMLRAGLAELASPTAPRRAAEPRPQAVPQADAAPAGGVVETVAMLGTYRMNGIGGALLFQYQPIVLYAGGRARDSERSPDLADDRDRGVRHGQWHLDGKALRITWSDGKRSESSKWARCRPAASGYVLQGRYSALQGGGNTAMGGTDSVAVSTTYSFDGQGHYALGRSAGSRTQAGDGATVTSSQGLSGGRYTVSGYRILLEPEGGTARSLLFCRYPDSEKAVFIGRTSFLRDGE